jgi:hypothetical protein
LQFWASIVTAFCERDIFNKNFFHDPIAGLGHMSLVLLRYEHMHEGNLAKEGIRDLHPKMENGEAYFGLYLCA